MTAHQSRFDIQLKMSVGECTSFAYSTVFLFVLLSTSSAADRKCNQNNETEDFGIQSTSYKDNNLTIQSKEALLMKVFQFGVATAVLSEGLIDQYHHQSTFSDLGSPSFYTHAYRWLLRHLSLWPSWLKKKSSYIDTHQVWRKRQEYSHHSLPSFIKRISSFWDWSKHDQMDAKLREFEMDFLKNEP